MPPVGRDRAMELAVLAFTGTDITATPRQYAEALEHVAGRIHAWINQDQEPRPAGTKDNADPRADSFHTPGGKY